MARDYSEETNRISDRPRLVMRGTNPESGHHSETRLGVVVMTAAPASARDPALATGSGSLYNHLMMFAWLGVVHAVVALVAVACYFLPHPVATCAIALVALAALTPVTTPHPAWGLAIARAITKAAVRYFPLTMEWEDERAYLDAAAKGVPAVIGLEPHSVLPLSIVAFGNYFFFTESTPECVRSSRALATGTIFVIPVLKHLWSWLGMDAISRRAMKTLLDDGRSVLIIPGGVAECLQMRPGVETIYLKKRFGFVKLAIQTGASLVPAFTFGQTRSYSYWRLGPPLVPHVVAEVFARACRVAPMVFWGKWGSPIPNMVPMHTVVGKPIPVKKQSEPSNEYVQEKLNEFVAAMESLYARHKGKHGYAESTLVVL